MKLRYLILGRKGRTNLDSVLKTRNKTLPIKAHIVKAMVFPMVMFGYESWTIKEAEHQRIDTFEQWCRWRLLRIPCTTRKANQSILKEVSPEYSSEGLMLKLKLQYFGQLMPKSWLTGKDTDAGKDWRQKDKRVAEDEMVKWHHWLNGWVWANSGRYWLTGKPGGLQSMGSQRVGQDLLIEQQQCLQWPSKLCFKKTRGHRTDVLQLPRISCYWTAIQFFPYNRSLSFFHVTSKQWNYQWAFMGTCWSVVDELATRDGKKGTKTKIYGMFTMCHILFL